MIQVASKYKNYITFTTFRSSKTEISKKFLLLFPLTINKSHRECSLLIETFFGKYNQWYEKLL